MYYIEKFVPLRYGKYDLEKVDISKVLGKQMRYASCGKAALYHCLLSLGLKAGDKVLVPNYICSSVLVPIKKIGLTPVFYDINESDLNANIDSIKNLFVKDTTIKALLVASMYGNPAALDSIEQFCHENHLFLIDDAAQSLGAKIGNRYVGTFGDAGFFSFSPGKATPGHLGAFYWTSNNNYIISMKNHYLYHIASYWSYYYNRYEIYRYKNSLLGRFTKYLELIARKYTNFWCDDVNSFERPILGGILYENFRQSFRKEFSSDFAETFDSNEYFKVVTQGAKDTNNHKLVILCKTRNIALSISRLFEEKGVCTINGYSLLDERADTPVALDIEKRVIEIPLENDSEKYKFIVQCLQYFIEYQKELIEKQNGITSSI